MIDYDNNFEFCPQLLNDFVYELIIDPDFKFVESIEFFGKPASYKGFFGHNSQTSPNIESDKERRVLGKNDNDSGNLFIRIIINPKNENDTKYFNFYGFGFDQIESQITASQHETILTEYLLNEDNLKNINDEAIFVCDYNTIQHLNGKSNKHKYNKQYFMNLIRNNWHFKELLGLCLTFLPFCHELNTDKDKQNAEDNKEKLIKVLTKRIFSQDYFRQYSLAINKIFGQCEKKIYANITQKIINIMIEQGDECYAKVILKNGNYPKLYNLYIETKYKQQIQQLEKENSSLKEKNIKLQQLNNELNSKLSKINKEFTEVKNEIVKERENNIKNNKLLEQLTQKKQENSSLTEKNIKLQQLNDELEKENKTINDKIKELNKKSELQNQLSLKNNKDSEINKKLQDIEKENEELKNKNKKLNDELEKVKNKERELKNKEEELKNQQNIQIHRNSNNKEIIITDRAIDCDCFNLCG